MSGLRLGAVGVALTLAGCSGTSFECDESTPCGFGEMCIAGECITSACSTSAQCPMEQYCDNRQCVAGCELDDDCYPGDACDVGEALCEPAGCTETSVDCGYRQFCNEVNGECYDAGGLYCHPCDEDWECNGDGANDNICYAGNCLVSCDDGRACPSGFDCYLFHDGHGNPVASYCFTYCWLYEEWESGRRGAEAPAPPAGWDYLAECATSPVEAVGASDGTEGL